MSACADMPSAATRQTANFTRAILQLRTVRQAGSHHELELPALHQLLEDAEFPLLLDVEHLVDGVVGLPDVGGRPRLELLELGQPRLQLVFAGALIQRAPQRVDDPPALVERLAADLLEVLEAREELRELL